MISRLINTNEKNKQIFYNTIGSFLVKGAALIISLYTMPAYIKYFDNQQILGLWFTIVSVLSWILTFDLGIGNGLRNYLVPALVNNDKVLIKKYISSAYVLIGAFVLFSILFSFFVFRYINWNKVFNISQGVVSKEVLSITVIIVFSGIMLQFLFKLVTSILYAMQKSALNNFLNLLSSIITLVYVLLAKSSDISTNLISLAVVNVLAVNLPLVIVSIIVFTNNLKGCKPEIRYFETKIANNIIKLGGMFFWVQIMYMAITSTNEFLITWLTGSEMVVEYQIYNKLFTLIGTIFMLTLTPIWSAVTKASSEKDYLWIKKLYRLICLMALLGVVCEFSMIPFLQFVIDCWLGNHAIQVNYYYAIIFAISGSLFIWNGVLSSFANGFGELKIQSICFTIGAVSNIPLSILFVALTKTWIGIIIANVIAMSSYCIIQPMWINKYLK